MTGPRAPTPREKRPGKQFDLGAFRMSPPPLLSPPSIVRAAGWSTGADGRTVAIKQEEERASLVGSMFSERFGKDKERVKPGNSSQRQDAKEEDGWRRDATTAITRERESERREKKQKRMGKRSKAAKTDAALSQGWWSRAVQSSLASSAEKLEKNSNNKKAKAHHHRKTSSDLIATLRWHLWQLLGLTFAICIAFIVVYLPWPASHLLALAMCVVFLRSGFGREQQYIMMGGSVYLCVVSAWKILHTEWVLRIELPPWTNLVWQLARMGIKLVVLLVWAVWTYTPRLLLGLGIGVAAAGVWRSPRVSAVLASMLVVAAGTAIQGDAMCVVVRRGCPETVVLSGNHSVGGSCPTMVDIDMKLQAVRVACGKLNDASRQDLERGRWGGDPIWTCPSYNWDNAADSTHRETPLATPGSLQDIVAGAETWLLLAQLQLGWRDEDHDGPSTAASACFNTLVAMECNFYHTTNWIVRYILHTEHERSVLHQAPPAREHRETQRRAFALTEAARGDVLRWFQCHRDLLDLKRWVAPRVLPWARWTSSLHRQEAAQVYATRVNAEGMQRWEHAMAVMKSDCRLLGTQAVGLGRRAIAETE